MNKRTVGIISVILLVFAAVIGKLTTQRHHEHPSQEPLRREIIAGQGFRVTKQHQDISAQFTLNPNWIPTKNNTKRVDKR